MRECVTNMSMIEKFALHNQFQESYDRFINFDPHLKRIQNGPFIYRSSLLGVDTLLLAGIYLITGGRQVGKTTFLKQWIKQLLEKENTHPDDILFIPGELVDTHHELRMIIEQFFDESGKHQIAEVRWH